MRSLGRLLVLSVLTLAATARAAPSTITVLYFDNDTGDPAYEHLGKGLADMTVTDLSAVPGIQVVEREKLEALLQELKLQRSKFFDPKTAQKIGKGVGAEYAVTGSFLSVAPDIRIDVRVVKIASGEVVKAHKVTGRKERFFDLQQQLQSALVDGLASTLSSVDAKKAKAGQSTSRVDNLGTALEYAKGLDLRDRGDLQSASQQMQKVMQSAPGFTLARSRYMQIMKDLYAAKDARKSTLQKTDETLLANLDKRIAQNRESLKKNSSAGLNWRMHLPPYVLRGELLLKRLGESLDRPAAEYHPHLKAYLANQQQLFDEILDFSGDKGPFGGGYGLCGDEDWRPMCVPNGDIELAADLGIKNPMTNPRHTDPHQILQDMASLLMQGTRPFYTSVKFTKRICFYKLDPSYAKRSLEGLERALGLMPKYFRDLNPRWIESETISLMMTQAETHLRLGKPEDAIARLQAALTKYPKAKEFAQIEGWIRGILSGENKTPDGKPILGACEDPR